MMYPTILMVSERLKNVLSNLILENPEQEIKSIISRFTTDIIGSCAFGIDCDCLNNAESEFLKMASQALMPRKSMFLRLITMMFPELAKSLGIKIVRDDVSEFFLRVFADVVKQRETENIQRNDFLNLLLQLKNVGKIQGETGNCKKLTFDQIAAEAFVFFVAGYESKKL